MSGKGPGDFIPLCVSSSWMRGANHITLGPGGAAGLESDSGTLSVSAFLCCCLSRALSCRQPKGKFPLIWPPRLIALPQQPPALLLEIEICLETTSSFKKKNRLKAFLPEVKSLRCVQSAKKKLCNKVPTVTLPPEPQNWIWTDLHK